MNHLEEIEVLIDIHDKDKLDSLIKSMEFEELLEVLENGNEEVKVDVFELISTEYAIKCFKVLEDKTRQVLIENMDPKKATELLNAIPDDDLSDFIEELPTDIANELLAKMLNDENRKTIISLLGYPEDSVGRSMTPHFIAVKQDWTVQQVLNFIRHKAQNSETVNVVYVTDEHGKLIDDIRIHEILLADPATKMNEIMDGRYIALKALDKETDAIPLFRKNNRFALPVTNENGILLGIITIDDVLRLAEEEDTEDIQKIGGTEALDEPYTQISFVNLIKKRAGWLTILFLGEMLTATAMGFFEKEISKAVVLALFIPLIISSGGNSGSQASSLIIRAMALGEIHFKDWWRVMRKEIYAGLTLGTILGSVGFLRIFIWQQANFYDYGIHWPLVAITIFFALIGVVLWGTVSGSMLPIMLRRLGLDPAASSAPFVATLVDVTGLVIYFSVAFLVLRGTLL